MKGRGPCRACAGLIAHERELREAAFQLLDERLASQTRAIAIATTEMDRRLEGMNEFREENRRNVSAMVSREAFDQFVLKYADRHQTIADKIDLVQRAIDRINTTVSTLRAIVAIVGAPGVLAMIWALIAAAANKTISGPGGLLP